jgi:hypothetical protein
MRERDEELGVEHDAAISTYFTEQKLRDAWKAVRIKQGRRRSVTFTKTLKGVA